MHFNQKYDENGFGEMKKNYRTKQIRHFRFNNFLSEKSEHFIK